MSSVIGLEVYELVVGNQPSKSGCRGQKAFSFPLNAGIDLDLHALEAAWKGVQVLPAPVAPRFIEGVQGEARRILIARLQHAAALYRGGFLQDFTLRNTLAFDNWIGMQQGYWYQRIEQVFDWLSRPGMPAGASSIAALTVLEHADSPTAVLAYHALARGSPDLTFRWYNITGEQEGILLRVVHNTFIHRRIDYACSTKWHLRTGDWLALLSRVRSACAW